jgi:cytochrome c biogenesis protein CcmG/thiol:disulfide interchange protein DsbE
LIMLGACLPVLALLALLGWGSLKSGSGPGSVGVNRDFGQVDVTARPAARFTLESMEGGTIDLADLQGKVVLVDFWASWCTPCRQEAPVLRQVYQEYADQPVEFVGVNIWDRREDAFQYTDTFDIPYPNGIDESGSIAIDYGVRGIPEKFFIDSAGVVRRKYVGPMHAGTLRAALDELLHNQSGKSPISSHNVP